jgi:hypothetical protein
MASAPKKSTRRSPRRTPTRWFGVKTIYRWSTSDRPRFVDEHYDPKATLVEERVVVFRAATFRQAIALAEREARAYARGTWTNLYGQRMRMEYLGDCDAFEMFDPPADGIEAYSRTQLVSRETRDRQLGDVLLGIEESPRSRAKRRKFANRDLAAEDWPKGETAPR